MASLKDVPMVELILAYNLTLYALGPNPPSHPDTSDVHVPIYNSFTGHVRQKVCPTLALHSCERELL